VQASAHSDKFRILVVEDDAPTLEALAYILKVEGYIVTCARDGRKGLEVLRRSPLPCAILLDLGMPILNGREFLKQQKQDPKVADIPVIVMTAAWAPVVPEAKAILPKPIDIARLFGLLAECCTDTPDN
jgi:CheY-like chemotaxis protein